MTDTQPTTMRSQILAPIKMISIPNDDVAQPAFTELAQHTVAQTDFVDHRGKLLTGRFQRSGLHRDGQRVVITVARASEFFPQKDIIDSGVVGIDGYTTFHAPADHPLAVHYLGQTWCAERAEFGTCIHSDCEFEA